MADRVFFGYHATSAAAAGSMIAHGFDIKSLGSGSGQMRGPGFYASATPTGAKTWADKILDEASGTGGVSVVKVYVPSGLSCVFGVENDGDCAWGIFASKDNPNGDGIIQMKTDHVDDLEVVIRPDAAQRITFEVHDGADAEVVQWPRYNAIVSAEQLINVACDWWGAKVELDDLHRDWFDQEEKEAVQQTRKVCEEFMQKITGVPDPDSNYAVAQQQRNLKLLKELDPS